MFDRIKNLMGAMVNNGVNKLETPELLLEQAEMELQENSKKLKEAVTDSVANEKLIENQMKKKATEFSEWEKRATIAVQNNNDQLATDCLKKKQEIKEAAQELDKQLAQQKITSANLKERASEIDAKYKDFLIKKPGMVARAKAGENLAKANELTSGTSGSSMDKWEEKIREKELSSDPLGTAASEQKFIGLDKNSQVDDELAALKAQITAKKDSEATKSEAHTPLLIEDKADDTEN